jgi:DNA-binding CsgD family transcriptional regulator
VLTQALGTFRRLGARSWAQRAQAELRACGVAVTGAPGDRDALGQLTPQQRQIVRLASDGLTDREIGDRLFLSPRTVSSHLYRSYPKLGVASRHQLRDVIVPASTPAPADESTRKPDSSLGRFPKQPRARWRPRSPDTRCSTAQQRRTGRSAWSHLNDPVRFMPPADRVPSGKCSKPADTPPLGSRSRLRPCVVTRHRASAASRGRLRTCRTKD